MAYKISPLSKILSVSLIALLGCHTAHAETPARPVIELSEGLKKARKGFASREAKALAEDFKGVRTSSGIQEGLFELKSTGVSTAPIVSAATDFLSSLNAEQRERTTFPVDDIEWRKWLNVDNGIYERQGVSLMEMNEEQKKQAFALMAASLSAKGLEQTRDIMKTDQTLKELNDNASHLDEELYFFTIMGEPSESKPWGWQVDGHHLAVNYFVLGDQVVFAPAFMGAEPVSAQSGKYKGNVLFQEEQNLGLVLMQSMDEKQQAKARLGKKSKNDLLFSGNADNKAQDYEGIPVSEFSATQKDKFIALLDEYIGNMREGHAAVKMEEVKAHLDDTWFGWRGDVNDDSVFYYRIHSPVVLIEFDHQHPIAMPNPDGIKAATRNHIHTMIRTPNGNDYGKDLLRQHLESAH